MNKLSLSWFRERLAEAVVIFASVFVQACSSCTSNKPETPQCDPNYSGCVPVASDVDCAGGRGDGPAYVQGPVKVIGRDIYQLDRDGNGIGCE